MDQSCVHVFSPLDIDHNDQSQFAVSFCCTLLGQQWRERERERDARRDDINFCSVRLFEHVVKPEPVAYDYDMFVA